MKAKETVATRKEVFQPTMSLNWKIADNAVKIFNRLREMGMKIRYAKVEREIANIAQQNKTDALQASELLWRLVREKKYYWVAEMETDGIKENIK